MTRLRVRRWHRRRTLGQALVETALAAPFLVILLAGSGQVGSIVYGQVTIDTAAREGARVAAENPTTGLAVLETGSPYNSPYTCAAGDPNAVCAAVRGAAGLLDGNSFTITITPNATLALWLAGSSDVTRVAGNGCNGTQAQISGVVDQLGTSVGMAGATVTTSVGGTKYSVTTASNGSYSFCTDYGTQVISATLTGWCADSGSNPQNISPTKNGTLTVSTLFLTTCPTPTPTPTPTATPSSSASPSPTSTPQGGGGGGTPPPVVTCTGATVPPGAYVTVTVSDNVPIFVPFVGRVLATPGQSYRTVTASVTMRVEPCLITQGH